MMRRAACFVVLCAIGLGSRALAATQPTTAPEDPRTLLREVCGYQVQMLERQDSRLRYQVHRVDAKGETTRDLMESHDGNVARLLLHNGQPLTTEENEGERERLEALVGKVKQREHEDAKSRSLGVEMLQVFPDAMQLTPVPQAGPVPDVADRQVVYDFAPRPEFHPSGMAQQVLTQLAGRLWIDANDHHLLRIEAHNSGEVNLAWGLLAKVFPGGSAVYEQRRFQDLYAFTHIVLHLRMRELMVKTAAVDTETNAGRFQRMAQSPGADEAIRMLLAEAVATR